MQSAKATRIETSEFFRYFLHLKEEFELIVCYFERKKKSTKNFRHTHAKVIISRVNSSQNKLILMFEDQIEKT